MSEGPIKRERAAWEPKRVSTDPKKTMHAWAGWPNRSYCGRKIPSGQITGELVTITCSDCMAALRADGAVS